MTIRISLFYAAIFLIVGIHVPFWPVWLTAQGMDAGDIGILLGSATVMKVFGSPMIARLVDRTGQRKKAIILLSLFSLFSVLFYFVFSGFAAFLAIAMMTALFLSPLNPLTDNLTLMLSNRGQVDYGRVRLWGSVSYALAALFGGMWLEGRDEQWVLWLLVGAFALMAITSWILPDVKTQTISDDETIAAAPRSDPLASEPGPFRQLLRSPLIWMFLLAAGLAQGSHVVFYGFGTLHWQSIGIGRETIGYFWAIGVVVEIILFAFATATLKRFDPATLLVAGAFVGVLRWTITGWSDDVVVLFVAQALHGLTFGVIHLGAMFFLARAVPVNLSASAQSLYSSVSLGLIFAVAMPAAGYLYSIFGGQAFYAMAGMSLVALVFAVGLLRRWDGGEISLGDQVSSRKTDTVAQ